MASPAEGADELVEDFDSLLIAERIISHLVDLAVAINSQVTAAELGEVPDDYKRSFLAAAKAGVIDKDFASLLAPSTGLRNILIHANLDLDFERFASSIPLAVDQYGEYIRQVAHWLQQRTEL